MATWGCGTVTGKSGMVTPFLLEIDPFALVFLNFSNQAVSEKPHSFNIYKPQVQGVSLSTWGVVRMELCFQLPELIKASRVRQNRRGWKIELNY